MSSKKNRGSANPPSSKYIILALFGKSGAGKDTIKKYLVQSVPSAKEIISCTTRPKRAEESNHIDYHFLSVEDFAEKVCSGSMLEATSFHNWFYGTDIKELKKDCLNIGVFNIQGIKCLLEDSRLNVIPIFVSASDKIRLKRALSREENPDCSEICRRFLADEKDFLEVDFNYITLNNNDKINISDL